MGLARKFSLYILSIKLQPRILNSKTIIYEDYRVVFKQMFTD